MISEKGEGMWLDHHAVVTLADLAEHSGFTEEEVRELVDYGALAPADAEQWTFTAECMVTLRKASRLRGDFELDPHALALTLTLLERIGALEAQLAQMRAQFPHRAA
jgi:chaperone modulatory protein CbpM